MLPLHGVSRAGAAVMLRLHGVSRAGAVHGQVGREFFTLLQNILFFCVWFLKGLSSGVRGNDELRSSGAPHAQGRLLILFLYPFFVVSSCMPTCWPSVCSE